MHFLVMDLYYYFSRKCHRDKIVEMCKALCLIAGFFIILYFADLALNKDETTLDNDGWTLLVENQPQKILSRSQVYQTKTKERNLACHFNSDCFDVYRCGANNGKLKGNISKTIAAKPFT